MIAGLILAGILAPSLVVMALNLLAGGKVNADLS